MLFDTNADVSVAVWVRPHTVAGYGTIVGRTVPCANVGNFSVDLSGRIPRFCYVSRTTGASQCASLSTAPVPLDQWTHLAFTYRYGVAGSFRGYVNGALSNTGTFNVGTGTEPPLLNATNPIEVGRFGGCTTGSQYFFDGSMAALAVWDRALTASEFEDHARTPAKLPCLRSFEPDAGSLDIVPVSSSSTYFATFQSNSQRIVDTRRGLFATFLTAPDTWVLRQSLDRGATWSTIYTGAGLPTEPPAIQADLDGTLYVMRQNDISNPSLAIGAAPSTLYLFPASVPLNTPPTTSLIPHGHAGKSTLLYDIRRGLLWYFAQYGTLFAISRTGAVLSEQALLRSDNAPTNYYVGSAYPHLALDENGWLYLAWTTVTAYTDGGVAYRNIQTIRTTNAGASFESLAGAPLTLPIVVGDSSPSTQVTQVSEVLQNPWLWSFVIREGLFHGAYATTIASPGAPSLRQSYVRLAADGGAVVARLVPQDNGLSPYSQDGALFEDPSSPRHFFLLGGQNVVGHPLALMGSNDMGTTLHGVARSLPGPTENPYSLSGARVVTEDGLLLGLYTNACACSSYPVNLVRWRVRAPTEPVGCF